MAGLRSSIEGLRSTDAALADRLLADLKELEAAKGPDEIKPIAAQMPPGSDAASRITGVCTGRATPRRGMIFPRSDPAGTKSEDLPDATPLEMVAGALLLCAALAFGGRDGERPFAKDVAPRAMQRLDWRPRKPGSIGPGGSSRIGPRRLSCKPAWRASAPVWMSFRNGWTRGSCGGFFGAIDRDRAAHGGRADRRLHRVESDLGEAVGGSAGRAARNLRSLGQWSVS